MHFEEDTTRYSAGDDAASTPEDAWRAVVRDPRMGGQVKRFHTWPVLLGQTVAEHGWQVARILYSVWPSPPPRLVVYALFHDVGEIGSGDVPSYAKFDHPVLKAELDRVQDAAALAMALPWGLPVPNGLDNEEAATLKFCDRMELWEHSAQEELMGNRLAAPMTRRVQIATIQALTALSPWPARHDRADHYMTRRRQTWDTR